MSAMSAGCRRAWRRRQRDLGRALERGAVGERVAVRQADLEQVRPGVDRGDRDPEARGRVRVAGDDVRDRATRPAARAAAEGGADPARARGFVRPAPSSGRSARSPLRRSPLGALEPAPERRQVLVAAARQPDEHDRLLRPRRAPRAGEELRQDGQGMGGLERGQDALRPRRASASPRTPRRRSRRRPPAARRRASAAIWGPTPG